MKKIFKKTSIVTVYAILGCFLLINSCKAAEKVTETTCVSPIDQCQKIERSIQQTLENNDVVYCDNLYKNKTTAKFTMPPHIKVIFDPYMVKDYCYNKVMAVATDEKLCNSILTAKPCQGAPAYSDQCTNFHAHCSDTVGQYTWARTSPIEKAEGIILSSALKLAIADYFSGGLLFKEIILGLIVIAVVFVYIGFKVIKKRHRQ